MQVESHDGVSAKDVSPILFNLPATCMEKALATHSCLEHPMDGGA